MSLNPTTMNYSTFQEEHFTFKNVSINQKSHFHPCLLDWMSDNPILELGGHAIYSQSEKSVQEINFSLSGKASSLYPLLRGIIASGQFPNLKLQVNHLSRSFILSFDKVEEKFAYNYITRILGIIQEEMRFKQVLRKVLENQKKFILEEKLLLNELAK